MSALYVQRMALGQASRRLAGKPLSTLLSAIVIAIALTLPALGYVLIDNLAGLARGVSGQPEISLFLKLDATPEQTRALEAQLRADSRIAALRFVPRDAALKQLAQRGGFAEVTGLLTDNPLPDAFVIEPRSENPEAFEALRRDYAAAPQIAHLQLDSGWVERLHALIDLGRSAMLLLGGIFAAALVIVTFNTIRLQILTQRHEIAVLLLLGATRDFVRRPFLYFGALQGLLGGLLAWGSVAALLRLVAPRLEGLAQRYSIVLDIGGPHLPEVLVLLVTATVLGWLGAALSVRRHLHDGPAD
ncbi:MAG: permease-like cell division protein FtsX [Moraxellaceae bacterium]|nr:permease-like cell division protein FtsX [Moraxellaceae bacterium]